MENLESKDYAKMLRACDIAIAQLKVHVEETKFGLDTIKAELMVDIAFEYIPETGKLKFSNESLRDAALVLRCASDDRFKALNTALREMTLELRKQEAERTYLNNMLSIAGSGIVQKMLGGMPYA